MATGKVLNAANGSSVFSLSAGFKDILCCCFSSNIPSKEEKKRDNVHDKDDSGNDKRRSATDEQKAEGAGEGGGGGSEADSEAGLILNTETGSYGSLGAAGAGTEGGGSDQAKPMDNDNNLETEDPGGVGGEGGGGCDATSNENADAGRDAAVEFLHGHDVVDGSIHCGRVRMTLFYDESEERLMVTVHETDDIPGGDRVNLSNSEVHFLLQPTKRFRYKTKAKSGDNPQFEETFKIKIPPDELVDSGLRVRLYGSEALRKEQLIGESYVALSSLDLDEQNPDSTWITLEPRQHISNVVSSTTSVQTSTTLTPSSQQAELMVGLTYSGTIGRLSVEIIQGTNIRNQNSTKPPDSYVKLRLMNPSGKELGRSKTAVRKMQPNPFYKETFVFHVPLVQLPEVSLLVSVHAHRNLQKGKMIGWFTLGHTNSTDDTLRHWKAMIESKGEQISQWHTLLTP